MNYTNTRNRSKSFDRLDYRSFQAAQLAGLLAQDPTFRMDSAEDAALFFARELDYIKSEAYNVKYPRLNGLEMFPKSYTVNEGAESITYYGFDRIGKAAMIHDYATDLPRVVVLGTPTTVPIKHLGASYGY